MPVSEQTSSVSYTGNGSVVVFNYPFQVVEAQDLSVFLDGTIQVAGFTINDVGVPAGGNVTFDVAPALGVLIVLRRDVPLERSTDYVEAGRLSANVLDSDFDRIVQMVQDIDSTALRVSGGNDWDVDGARIINVADPVDPQDAVTLAYSDATWGNAPAEAAASAAAALESENNALASENLADQWANEAEDVEVTPGEYSAYHWASKAGIGVLSTLEYDGTTKVEALIGGCVVTGDMESDTAHILTLTHGGTTYPSADGAVGQLLIADGSGAADWTDLTDLIRNFSDFGMQARLMWDEFNEKLTTRVDGVDITGVARMSVGAELGNLAVTGSTPLDFHTSGNGNDWDSRILGTQESAGGLGDGTLEFQAANFRWKYKGANELMSVGLGLTNINGNFAINGDNTNLGYYKLIAQCSCTPATATVDREIGVAIMTRASVGNYYLYLDNSWDDDLYGRAEIAVSVAGWTYLSSCVVVSAAPLGTNQILIQTTNISGVYIDPTSMSVTVHRLII